MKKKSLNAKKTINSLALKYLKNKDILKIYNEFEDLLNPKTSYAVAISGGTDSIALAYLSKCFSIINNKKIYFFIVDHKLRDESSEEAKKVKNTLKKFNINCQILVWKGKKPKTNIQAIARDNRYSLLINECKKKKIKNLLLGHHIDDLYENFLLRLMRGSGLKGLTSMDKTTLDYSGNINILRPLINLEKKDLQIISKNFFNFFVEDPSNSNEDFKRIRIRKWIKKLESEGLDKKKLKMTLKNLKNSDNAISFYVKKNIEENSAFLLDQNTYILNNSFFEQPEEIIFRSFSDILRKINKRYYPVRGKSINAAILNLKSKKLNKITLGGCLIEKVNETVLISTEKSLKT